MSGSNVPRYGLAVDFETSGLSPIKNQGISLGAVIFDTTTFEEVDAIYAEIQFDATKYEWTTEAERVHGLSREYLDANGLPQDQAAMALIEFIYGHCGTESVLWLGHNPRFDISFAQQLLKTVDFSASSDWDEPGIRLHHVILDTQVLSFFMLGVYRSSALFERLKMPPRGKHNALEDVRMTLQAAREMKALFGVGMAALT